MYGCLDENACNYDNSAVLDDGNCLYNAECGNVNIDLSIDIFEILNIILIH